MCLPANIVADGHWLNAEIIDLGRGTGIVWDATW